MKPKEHIELRLHKRGWRPSTLTSTHKMFHKPNWICTIHRVTGKVRFKRTLKGNTVDLIRGEIERGIE